MATIPDDLMTFLAEHRDSREYRRALAVKLARSARAAASQRPKRSSTIRAHQIWHLPWLAPA